MAKMENKEYIGLIYRLASTFYIWYSGVSVKSDNNKQLIFIGIWIRLHLLFNV